MLFSLSSFCRRNSYRIHLTYKTHLPTLLHFFTLLQQAWIVKNLQVDLILTTIIILQKNKGISSIARRWTISTTQSTAHSSPRIPKENNNAVTYKNWHSSWQPIERVLCKHIVHDDNNIHTAWVQLTRSRRFMHVWNLDKERAPRTGSVLNIVINKTCRSPPLSLLLRI